LTESFVIERLACYRKKITWHDQDTFVFLDEEDNFFRHKEHDEQENLSAIDFGPEEDEYEDDGQYIRGITTSNIS
jgi:hypothetical protein